MMVRAAKRAHGDAAAVQSGFSDRCDLYATQILGACKAVARDSGYALAALDKGEASIELVAVPWAPSAAPAEKLAEDIRLCAASILGCAFTKATAEPLPLIAEHGRCLWPIHLGGDVLLNLSIMPRRRQAAR